MAHMFIMANVRSRLIAFAAPKVFDITIVWLSFELDAAHDQIAHAKTLGARENKPLNESGASPQAIVRQRLTYPPPGQESPSP
jgi:hypothetical protein